jgi:alpha-D-xyloside xylohydrolase
MNKYNLVSLILALILQFAQTITSAQLKQSSAGVQKISLGLQDKFTPYGFCEELPMQAALAKLPAGTLPFNISEVKISTGVLQSEGIDGSAYS